VGALSQGVKRTERESDRSHPSRSEVTNAWSVNSMKMAVFWVVAPRRTSETLVNFYQTTRCYNPEDSHLRTHRRENLKSYLLTPRFLHVLTT
jgi:hypothetical protein